jgi:hypothetical protein
VRGSEFILHCTFGRVCQINVVPRMVANAFQQLSVLRVRTVSVVSILVHSECIQCIEV